MSQQAAKYVQPSESSGPSGSASIRHLTRRRMAALLALAPIGIMLSACATEKPHDGRQQQPTYKNGQRGSGGSRGD
jgi:hypothetical protein